MRASIAAVAAGLLGLACLGCTTTNPAPVARPSPVLDVPRAPVATPSALPVDPSIEPVARSNPSANAARALRACGVGSTVGAGLASRMGRVDHARDAVRYVPLTGREPELSSASPAWMITFRGSLPMPKSGEDWIDPFCIVVAAGQGGFYATGPVRDLASGVTVTPDPAVRAPTLALPPLLP